MCVSNHITSYTALFMFAPKYFIRAEPGVSVCLEYMLRPFGSSSYLWFPKMDSLQRGRCGCMSGYVCLLTYTFIKLHILNPRRGCIFLRPFVKFPSLFMLIVLTVDFLLIKTVWKGANFWAIGKKEGNFEVHLRSTQQASSQELAAVHICILFSCGLHRHTCPHTQLSTIFRASWGKAERLRK